MSVELKDFEDRLATALRAHATELAAPPRRHARRRLWPLAPIAAVGAVAALLLLLPGREPAPASAAVLLRSAAAASEHEPPLPAGSYLYVRRRFTAREAIAPVHDGVEERWTRADGSGRILVRDAAGRVVEDTTPKAGGLRIGSETVPPARLRGLRASSLRRLLERQAKATVASNPGFDPGQLRAYTAYTILRDVLDTPFAARLRAEAYRALAAAPGLSVAARASGQVTVAARVGDVELRSTIDPADGRLLGLERRLLRRSSQLPGPPGVVDRAVVVERGVVGSTRARP
jgi:hypothetical protein